MSERLNLSSHSYRYADVRGSLADPNAFDEMPFSHRIFAENIVRRAQPAAVPKLLDHIVARRRDVDLPYYPARVVLQDLLGTPALVDLAALRDAVAERGGDPAKVNPQVPVHLVIDHSVNVIRNASPQASRAGPKNPQQHSKTAPLSSPRSRAARTPRTRAR